MSWLNIPQGPLISTFSLGTSLGYQIGLVKHSGVYYSTDIGFMDISGCIYILDTPFPSTTGTVYFQDPALVAPCGLLVDSSGYMYICDYFSGTIWKGLITPSNPSFSVWVSGLPNSGPFAMVIYGDYMYCSILNGDIAQISMSDGTVTNANWCSGLMGPSQMVVIGSTIYVGCANGVYTVPIITAGSTPSLLFSFTVGGPPTGLAYFNNYLYLVQGGSYIDVYDTAGALIDTSFNDISLLNSVGLYAIENRLYATQFGSVIDTSAANVVCFLKGTMILTDVGYTPIEYLTPGTPVKTLLDGYIPVDCIRRSSMYNPLHDSRTKNRLYLLSKSLYPSLAQNLVLTGTHSVLVDSLTIKQTTDTREVLGQVFVTNNKYRLPACADERAVVYPYEGTFDIYHVCLKNANESSNYGIYANGLLVESCCKKHI